MVINCMYISVSLERACSEWYGYRLSISASLILILVS